MRAATRTRYGPPSALKVGETLRPEPSANEILVRVRATTVSRTDCGVLTGKPFPIRFFTGLVKPKLAIPGTDFAGDVTAVGPAVTTFREGDRVWGFNDTGLASQCEFTSIASDTAVCPIPDGISYAQAAASAEGAHYAINFMKRAKYVPGQRVFVYGATGAIGSAAVQILKAAGSPVTAACPREQIDRVYALGADAVVDYRQLDFSNYPDKFDLFFDAVGKSNFATSRPLLTAKGKYLSSELGPHGQNVYLPFTTRLRPGQRVDFPVPTGSRESLQQMTTLLAAGKFDPMIDRHYHLEQVRDAYEYVLTGQKLGNVILDID